MASEGGSETLAEVEARLDAEDKAIQAADKAPEGDLLAQQEANAAAKAKADADAKGVADKAAADAKAKDDATKTADEKAKAEAAAAAKPEPAIPLSRHKAILQSERAAREAAEARVQEFEQAKATTVATTKPGPKRDALIAKLREDMPAELIDFIEGQEAEITALRSKVEGQEQAGARSVADAVQDDIDQNADLHAWQDKAIAKDAPAEDLRRWELAEKFDTVLSQSPKWSGKPRSERFAKVAEMVRDEFGDPDPTPKPAGAAAAAPAPKTLPAPTRAAPTTLSDVPGGLPPVTDRVEAFNRLDPMTAAAAAQRMTDAQFEQFVSGMS